MHHPLMADLFTFMLKITYRLKSVTPKLNFCRVDSRYISGLTQSVISDKTRTVNLSILRG